MDLLQVLRDIYDYQEKRGNIGKKISESVKIPLLPLHHILINSDLEVTIDQDGNFRDAQKVTDNRRTIIPVKTTARTSGISPHPLNDNLGYLTEYPCGDSNPDSKQQLKASEKHQEYIKLLTSWVEFSHHPKLEAVLKYTLSETLLEDLKRVNLVQGEDYSQGSVVRYRVIGLGVPEETYKDTSLRDSWADYKALTDIQEEKFCPMCGKISKFSEIYPHLKGILSSHNDAKLFNKDDNHEMCDECAGKVDRVLKWMFDNFSWTVDPVQFMWFKYDKNSHGNDESYKRLLSRLIGNSQNFSNDSSKVENLKSESRNYLTGFKDMPNLDTSEVLMLELKSTSTGRLSLHYNNELRASDLISRVSSWYSSMAYNDQGDSPSLKELCEQIDCPIQGLLHCIIEGRRLPDSLVSRFTHGFSRPPADKNKKLFRNSAFAVVKKYRNDKYKEEWTLALNKNCTDRSYLFGRLLAVADSIEFSAYSENKSRTTHAEGMFSSFVQHPLTSWKTLEAKLKPYSASIQKSKPGLYYYFNQTINDILDKLDVNDPFLNSSLSELFILGYHHQKSYKPSQEENQEVTEHEKD